MTRIAIKRVYEPATDTDGLRVLVDKLWPRGIRKEALHYDLWAFVARIEKEPRATLLYASKNAEENHARVLREYLERESG